MPRRAPCIALAACLASNCFLFDQALSTETDPRFEQLRRALSGATLVGTFTEVNGGDAPAELHAERYELKQVRHTDGDNWLFACRIRYGDHDVTVPLVIPVLWAGDTPVIALDTLPVPGLGSFTARVLIHDDYYAGYWSGEGHGGHLFGRVVREQLEPNEDAPRKVD